MNKFISKSNIILTRKCISKSQLDVSHFDQPEIRKLQSQRLRRHCAHHKVGPGVILIMMIITDILWKYFRPVLILMIHSRRLFTLIVPNLPDLTLRYIIYYLNNSITDFCIIGSLLRTGTDSQFVEQHWVPKRQARYRMKYPGFNHRVCKEDHN